MAIIMSGKEVAGCIKDEVNQDLLLLKSNGIFPQVALVRVGERTDSIGYERSAITKFNQMGIDNHSYHFPKEITEAEFISEFQKVNNDNNIHAILLLRPLPPHINEDKISNIINPIKDIDGMSFANIGKVLSPERDDFVPITPVSVMRTLEYYDIDLQGKNAVVIGHSRVVGKPLTMLLADKNATVTICHIHTKNTAEISKNADILISATGKAGLVTKDFVKQGAVVLDVGTSYKDGRLSGDVDFDNVKDIASYITPVPGGIGAITTSLLSQRVIIAAKRLTSQKDPHFV